METFRPTLFIAAAGGIAGMIAGRLLRLDGLLENLACFLAGMLLAYFIYEILTRKKKETAP